MAVIKATKKESHVTCIQPDYKTQEVVKDLIERGYTNIHDAETGEKFTYTKVISAIACPLCETPCMKYKKYTPNKFQSGGHAWVCDECPAILFEFWHNEDLENLKEIIK